MAIKSLHNFEKDPYYSDLYEAPKLTNQIINAFNQYEQLQSRQLQNQVAERKLQQEQRQLDTGDKLAEMMSSGQLSGQQDIYAAMQQSSLESGDVNTYLSISKAREAEDKNEETRKYGIFQMLKETDPTQAAQFYNINFADKYGAISEDSIRPKPKSFREDGQIFYEGPDGSITPGTRYAPSSRGGRGGDKEPTYSPETFEGPNGEIKRINAKDPNNNALIEELYRKGWKEKGKSKDVSPLEQLIASQLTGGLGLPPVQSPILPQATPSAMPSVMPSAIPSPVPTGKVNIPPGVKVNKKIL